jgi:hypothetical protein
MAAESDKSLFEVVNTRVVRLNAMVQSISVGLIVGLVIFIATNWLVLEGGHLGPEGQPIVGPHLSLLGQFFIGYEVTFVGSLIGFVYGAIIGFIGGYTVSTLYNWLAGLRERRR